MFLNPSQRFPKKQKLLHTAEFDAVFREGKKQSSRFFACISKQNDLSYPRLGIVVGKKAIRRSVERNRIKRIIRESFRLNKDKLYGIDVIVLIYPDVNKLNKIEFRQRLDEQWAKLK